MGVFSHSYSLEVEEALLNSFQYFSPPDNIFMSLSKNPRFWRSPAGNIPEESHEAA